MTTENKSLTLQLGTLTESVTLQDKDAQDPRIKHAFSALTQTSQLLEAQYKKFQKQKKRLEALVKGELPKNSPTRVRYTHFPNQDHTRLVTVAYIRNCEVGTVSYGACIWTSIVEYVEPSLRRFSERRGSFDYEKCKTKTYTKRVKKQNRETAFKRFSFAPVEIVVRPGKFRKDLRQAIVLFGVKSSNFVSTLPFKTKDEADMFGRCHVVGQIGKYNMYMYEDKRDAVDAFLVSKNKYLQDSKLFHIFSDDTLEKAYDKAVSFAREFDGQLGVYQVFPTRPTVVLYDKDKMLGFVPNEVEVLKDKEQEHEYTDSDEE